MMTEDIESKVLHQNFFKATVTLTELPTFEFLVYDKDKDIHISRCILEHGIWEAFETYVLMSLLRPQDCFVNAGANIGWYVVIASHCVGIQGKVLAFEPENVNYFLLRKNVKQNALSNVEIENKALSATNGEVTLYLSDKNCGDHRIYSRNWSEAFDKTVASAIVEKVPLSNYQDRYPQINCLMMDTQGAELDILRGIQQSLEGTIILMEFWPNGLGGNDPNALDELLDFFDRLPHQCYELISIDNTLIHISTRTLKKRAQYLQKSWSNHANLLFLPPSRQLPDVLKKHLVVRTLDESGNWIIPSQITPESTIDPPPACTDVKKRVNMTIRCHDTDTLPRAPLAGQKVEYKGILCQIMRNGLSVVAERYPSDEMTHIIEKLQGVYEPQKERVFYDLVKKLPMAPIMIELGTYWAYYSLWVKHEFPQARCICVEPDENNIAIAKKNFFLNGCSAEFLEGSIGENYKEALSFHRESDGKNVIIPQFSVDYLMNYFELPFLDLLYVDARGVELSVLFGALETFRRGKIRFIVLSTHHVSISDDPIIHQRCLKFFQQTGAHIIAEHNTSESFSGDGLIVVSYDENDKDFVVTISKNVDSVTFYRENEWECYEERIKLEKKCSMLHQQINSLEENIVKKHWRNRLKRIVKKVLPTPVLRILKKGYRTLLKNVNFV